MPSQLSLLIVVVAAAAWPRAARAGEPVDTPGPQVPPVTAPAPAPEVAAAPVAELDVPPSRHELTIGGYVQPQLELREDDAVVGSDEDGFRLRRARLQLGDTIRYGRLTLRARIEVEVASQAEMEDGYASVGSCLLGGGTWRIDAGQFKAPVSRQALLSDSRIAFVEKAELAGLAPGRQLGVAATVEIPGVPWLVVAGGLFNGEGQGQGSNVDQRFLWAGRVEVRPFGRDVGMVESNLGEAYLVVGASAAQNRRSTGDDVERARTVGADVAFGWRGLSGTAEYLEVRHHRRDGGYPDFGANGLVAQVAYLLPLPGRLARRAEVGFRFQEIDRNDAVAIERPGDPEQSARSYHLAATWYQRGHDLKLQVDLAHVVEVEDITRTRTDARYDNDTVLVQATYRLEAP